MQDFLKREFRSLEGESTYDQTLILFGLLEPFLKETIRTWLFIKDIDNTYDQAVRARNKVFDRNGLVPGNHFLASTGIGRPDDQFYPGELIHLDALIVPGLDQNNLIHMSHEDVMPNTSTYGVRFERGSIYNAQECSYYIVSGTASIDSSGNVKYLNDLEKQTYHAINNIDSLLFKYDENIHNAKEIIGYVRNPNDAKVVEGICKRILPNTKWIIIEGKICRPEWLVEFETTIKSDRGWKRWTKR